MTTDTMNQPAANAVTSTTQVLEPGPASPSTEGRRHSPKPLDDPSRCRYRYPNGRRCCLPGLPAKSGLCLRHYHRQVAAGLPLSPSPNDFEDLSADLLPGHTHFSSSEDLRDFLSRLLIETTKGRVSPRRAAVLAYITNQLLHSHRAIIHEQKDKDKAGGDTDMLHLFPPHLQEIILQKRRFAAEAYAKSESAQAKSPEEAGRAFYARFRAHSVPNDINAPTTTNTKESS